MSTIHKSPLLPSNRGRQSRRWIALAALCFQACDLQFGPQSHDRLPILSGLLIAGQREQVVILGWGLSPNAVITSTPAPGVDIVNIDPIDSTQVELHLRAPDGVTAQFRPDPEDSLRYVASMSIAPGMTYRLEGVIAGRPVSATTHVPGRTTIVSPGTDSAFVSTDSAGQLIWSVTGAGGYLITDRPVDGTPERVLIFGDGPLPTADTTLPLLDAVPRLDRPQVGDRVRVEVLSLDRGFVRASRPEPDGSAIAGNVQGTFGLLASATWDDVLVIFR